MESRILVALFEADDLLSTNELARRIERSVGATARALPGLRQMGLTTERSAGRQKLNGITVAGREKAERIAAEWRSQDQALAGPDSLTRQPHEQAVPMDARDIVRPAEINDAVTLLKDRGRT